MVDIKDYYYAALLDHMQHWFQVPTETLWLDIESALAPVNDLHLLLQMDIWAPLSLDALPPSIKASLIAWRSLQNNLKHSKLKAEVQVPSQFSKYVLLPHLNQTGANITYAG